jgi:phosphoribosylanthranilate isomerase
VSTPVGAASASGRREGGIGRVRVKVCGLTRAKDALLAERLGVDAVGVVFAAGSRRRVDLDLGVEVVAPLGPFVTRVGVFRSPAIGEVMAAIERLRLHAVQLHGDVDEGWVRELRQRVAVIRALAWRPGLDRDGLAAAGADALLIDGPDAGSGTPFDWRGADGLRGAGDWILAGGLHPGNVAEAIERLRPAAVDVASGVEASAGVKDPARLAAFMAAVRRVETVVGGP